MDMKSLRIWVVSTVLTSWSFGQDAASSPPQESNDPFASDSGLGGSHEIAPERAEQITAGIEVRMEIFDLPTLKVIQLLDERESDSQLRQDVLNEVQAERGKIIEVTQIRTEAGLAATVEGICETIYPTEYEPPESLVNLQKIQEEAQNLSRNKNGNEELSPLEAFVNQLAADATPTAFETRNLGATTEVLVKSVEAQEETWDIAIATEFVTHVGEKTWMAGTVEMPLFTTWRVNQSFRIPDKEWVLASIGAIGDREQGANQKEKRLLFLQVSQVR